MIILAVKTDQEQAEIWLYDGKGQVGRSSWPAHRRLADTLNREIDDMLHRSNIALGQVQGIVVFQGPGSFTGLRIGASVANALSYALRVPVVATRGKHWLNAGITKLNAGQSDKIAKPLYGRPVSVTKPK